MGFPLGDVNSNPTLGSICPLNFLKLLNKNIVSYLSITSTSFSWEAIWLVTTKFMSPLEMTIMILIPRFFKIWMEEFIDEIGSKTWILPIELKRGVIVSIQPITLNYWYVNNFWNSHSKFYVTPHSDFD